MAPQSAPGAVDALERVQSKNDVLLTADELAARWQVRPAQVYRLTRDGCLQAVRIGRYYRYRLAAIEAFEQAGGVAADV